MLACVYAPLLIACLLQWSHASITGEISHSPTFESFVQTYSRRYQHGTKEYESRRSLYQQRLAKVEQHNKQPQRLWTAGVNELSDWTEEELKTLRGWRGGASSARGHAIGEISSHRPSMNLRQTQRAEALPAQKSWAHLSTSQKIRNQGACGSCWAITGATVLDANAEIHLGQVPKFSTQQFVSCVPNKQHCGGEGGCQGATVELAFNWVMRNHASSEDDQPYLGADSKCPHTEGFEFLSKDGPPLDAPLSEEDVRNPGVHLAQSRNMPGLKAGLKGWERLPENKYEPLLRALVNHGPVAVSVAADGWSNYERGIFNSCERDAVIDHAVTLIGYGKDKTLRQKFWHIQNSWGPDWGESGTIRLFRDDDEENVCGTDRQPEVGTGCDGGPTEVRVCGTCGILYDTVVPHFLNTTSQTL